MTMAEDVRWKQRLENLRPAFQTLHRGVNPASQRELSELEQLGLFHEFEFTHELAWNVLKDYLEEMGVSGMVGSKGETREAFRNGLIEDGETWMEMIRTRKLSLHTYNPETAEKIVEDIRSRFHPAFERMLRTFEDRAATSREN